MDEKSQIQALDRTQRLLPMDMDFLEARTHDSVRHATHKAPKVERWLAKLPRWPVRFTPTEASWLSLVERCFAEVTTQRIRRGTFRSVQALESAIREYLDLHNEQPEPFVWTATAEDIFGKIYRPCERICR